MRKDLFASIGLLLIAAFYYATATTFPVSTLDEPGVPGPSSLPTVLAALLAVIAITLGVRAVAAAPARGGKSEEKETEAPWPRALGMLAIGASYILVASLLGYLIALFLLLVAVALYERQRPDWRPFVIAGCGALFFWFIFAFILGVRPPEGILFGLLGLRPPEAVLFDLVSALVGL
jgi:hypothetical protein